MIKELHLQNFQSHKQSLLKFSDGVNIIIGQSDSGKTAIIRALLWVINNRPSGDAFRSKWGGRTSVEVIFNRGAIERIKGDSENSYYVHIPDPDNKHGVVAHTLKAFGQDVPKEISDIARLSDINTQSQMDAPFLLSESSGEVARKLNEIVNLDIIDTAQSNANRMVRENNSTLETTESALKEAKGTLSGYDWLDDAENDIAEIEHITKRNAGNKDRTRTLQLLITKTAEWKSENSRIKKYIPAEKEFDTITILHDSVKSSERKFSRLLNLVEDISKTKDEISDCSELVKSSEKEFHRLMPDFCPLCGHKRN